MSTALITRARAQANFAWQSAFTAEENQATDYAVAAVSAAIQAYCKRTFTAQGYDELSDGSWSDRLTLRQRPIISVSRVCCNPVAVLRVTNTSSSNSRSTVSVAPDALRLVHVASGVTTATELLFADYATLTLLAAAVAAVGSGWDAESVDGYETWPSADLRAVQGAVFCQGVRAPVFMHVEEMSEYGVDPDRGWLYRTTGYSPDFSAFEDLSPHWTVGPAYWRIVYEAGFAEVPANVQEGCAQWAAALFLQGKRDPGLSVTKTEGVETMVTLLNRHGIPAHVKSLLDPFVLRGV